MALIRWNDSYSVGVEEFDSQHKKLVDLINELHDAMKKGKSKDVLLHILGELANYTKVHFTLEEKYMKKYNYPDLTSHHGIHVQFVEKVLDFKDSYSSGSRILSMEIMHFLKDWLLNHIKGTDKEYTKFFNEKGLK